MLKIVTDLKILRQVSTEVTAKESKDIIKALETVLSKYHGWGLSAIQIGIAKQVSIIRIGKLIKTDLINPKIITKYDKFKHIGEACLSIPGLKVDTLRYREIELINNAKKCVAGGIEALVIQHEVSHFAGRLLMDDKWRRK